MSLPVKPTPVSPDTIGPDQRPISSSARLLRGLAVLVKAPLSLMAAFPAVCAFIISAGAPAAGQVALFFCGTVFSAFGASALNQWSERSHDAAMHRTRARPIPSGILSPAAALTLALLFAITGVGLLFIFFNAPAALLSALTIVLYWLVYTPLKRWTPWCTEVGAVAGALPALIGSAAASGTITPIGWILFLIVFLWQMPHFHPIAWRHREDYRRGGYRMLATIDGTGRKAAEHSLAYAVLLLAAATLPVLWGAGPLYWIPATVAGLIFILRTAEFGDPVNRNPAAHRLFRFSLVYLAVVLTALLIDHLF